MQWNNSYQENLLSFANNINTHEGGSHLSGFRSALTRTINAYARQKGLLKEKEKNLEGEDVREGLTAIISVKVADPQFEGQTKTKLGNPPVEGFVQAAVNKGLAEFLEENPADARRIITKAVEASRAREAARKARDLTRRKSALENSTPARQARRLLGRATPRCRELFIVEGDSAGGSAKQGRDRNTQAILPLRGKIINVEKNRIDKVLANKEIQALITAIGTGIREEFDAREGPLPQGHRHDRRRRGRRTHPHAGAHVPLPRDAGADRGRLRVHRQAAALQGHERQAGPLHREGVGARGGRAARQAREADVTDRAGTAFKLTHARWQKYVHRLKQYEGWASALKAEFGHDPITFLEESQILDEGITDDAALVKLLKQKDPEEEPFETELVSEDPMELVVQVIERKTGHRLHAAPAPGPLRPAGVPLLREGARRAQVAGRHAAVRRLARQEARAAPCRSRTCAARCSTSPARACRCSASRASAR